MAQDDFERPADPGEGGSAESGRLIVIWVWFYCFMRTQGEEGLEILVLAGRPLWMAPYGDSELENYIRAPRIATPCTLDNNNFWNDEWFWTCLDTLAPRSAKYKSSYGDSELGNYIRAPRIERSWNCITFCSRVKIRDLNDWTYIWKMV